MRSKKHQVFVCNINRVTKDREIIKAFEEAAGPVSSYERPAEFRFGYAFIAFKDPEDAERVIANPPEIHLDGRRLWIERFVKGRKAQERWSKEKKKPLKLVQAAPAAVTPAPAAVVSVVPSPRREERRALRQVGATSLQQTIAAIAVDGVPMLVALAPASVAKDERTAEEREQEERERRVIEEQQQYARQQHEAAVRAQAALLAPPSVAAQRGQFCVGCGESNLSGFSFCNFCGLASGGVPKQIALAPASVPAVAAPHSVVAAPPSVAAATSVPKSAVTGKFEMDLKQMLEAVNLGMYGPELEKEGIRSAKALQDSKVVAGMKPFHKKKLERIVAQLLRE